ncbi:MAG: hypothetical protein IJX92_07900 [Clostridia bacterium]|nr:hypothetical protein [Clostridia bacterium]
MKEKNEKLKYSAAEYEIILFGTNDLITTSGGGASWGTPGGDMDGTSWDEN